MTVTVQISSPVIPNKPMTEKLTERIQSLVTKGTTVKVAFYESGFDSFGQINFDVIAFDTARRELTELRNAVMVELFTILFQNSK